MQDVKAFATHAVWINLEKRKDRREGAKQQWKYLPQATHQFVVAIEEKPGFMGCTKSHMKALRVLRTKLFEKQLEYGLLFEDDFRFDMEQKVAVDQAIRVFQPDVLSLATNPWDLENTNVEGVQRVKMSGSASALLIRASYIPRLLRCYEAALRKEKPLDVEWLLLQRQDKWYVNKLGGQEPGFSDIEGGYRDYGGI